MNVKMQYLQVANAVEDDIQAAWNDAFIVHLTIHCVSLARSSDTISKEQAILSMHQILNQRQCDGVDYSLPRDFVVKHSGEDELGCLVERNQKTVSSMWLCTFIQYLRRCLMVGSSQCPKAAPIRWGSHSPRG